MPALAISVLRDLSDLERIHGEWDQLLARMGGLKPSLTPTWLLTWWRVFGELGGRRLHVLAIRDGRALVGLVPLLARRHVYHRVIPMRRLELLASGEDEADEILSEYLGPIAECGREAAVLDVVAHHLVTTGARWDEIVFSALDGLAPAVQAIEPAFRRHGLAVESRVTGQCPFIALPKRWEDYLAALSSDNRYMAKRSLRDFDRWAGRGARVEVAKTQDELLRGKAILQRLHEHRWQSGGKDGVFASTTFTRFHDMLMPSLLDRGELDLRWLSVNDEPVAASYSVVSDNRIFYYQGGRATDVPKGVRPGIVLHLEAIRAAIDAGRLEYDFLGGDARYKVQLAPATRPLVEVRVARRSLPEVARKAAVAARPLVAQARSAWAARLRGAPVRPPVDAGGGRT